MATSGTLNTATPWDRARKILLVRQDLRTGRNERLDCGVNYFVAMLEALGARPQFSCEGHPFGFYVLFEAPVEVALKIKSAGFFDVCLEGEARWSIRLRGNEVARYSRWTERTKRRCLRRASVAWEQALSGESRVRIKAATSDGEIPRQSRPAANGETFPVRVPICRETYGVR